MTVIKSMYSLKRKLKNQFSSEKSHSTLDKLYLYFFPLTLYPLMTGNDRSLQTVKRGI